MHVILVLVDVQWVLWDHSTSETPSPFSACFQLSLLERKWASSLPPPLSTSSTKATWRGGASYCGCCSFLPSLPWCSRGNSDLQLAAGGCCCFAMHSRGSCAASHNQNLPGGGKNPQLCKSTIGNRPRMGNQLALFHCWLFFFFSIYKFSTEPCAISHLLITDFLCGWDADFSYTSVNLEQLYRWAYSKGWFGFVWDFFCHAS